ncbi:PBP1A family penicillin-binding protein [Virgibacillus sp. C22-A2]|uniref:PBP1A family penicillin-binding protein n=1 Tax=Virgibacillus tibetensis TaxID=3042313 RepID=A0ABU6KJ78_9BACI|nr:PBP1A family penicillin-binding protein [Virgibacillus sp. C22-A2]
MKPIRIKNRFIIKVIIAASGMMIALLIGVYLISFLLGPPTLLNDQNTIYYSSSGEVIGNERGLQNRYWKNLKDMSPHIVNATLIIEDQNFFDHNGFDFKRIAGAVIKDLRSLSLKEGASTLTQQYARNLYLNHEKTWSRKIKEAFYTVRLEMFYTKEEILEGYLNTIYYGHGAYGIEAASNYFFSNSSAELTLAEASMLAGVPKGPTYYSPVNDLERSRLRQSQILSIMLTNDVITEQEQFLATREHLIYSAENDSEKGNTGPHFQYIALKEASEILELEMEEIRAGGFEIYTTLNKTYQQQLEEKINQVINPTSDIEVGALSIDPHTGGILAMVGGRDYHTSPFNRTTSAKRMAGSAFKPFLYYAALDNGYNAGTMLMSKPTVFELDEGELYQPSNFNGYYAHDTITLAQAIALSDNIYAVKTNLFLGSETLVETAGEFGIGSKLPAVPSLALGTASVSVVEMVRGYAMLANGGHELTSYTIEKIIDRNGKNVFEKENKKSKPVLDPKKAFILTHMMTGMFDRELDGYMAVTGSTIANELTRLYAGKSGTTKSDSWMIGYSPSLVTGIWTGYDDNRNMEIVAESAYAKQIWARFMEEAHKGSPQESFPVPAGVVGVPIDPSTGDRATPYCNTSRVMYFEKGTEPQAYCTDHFHDTDDENEKSMVEKLFDLFN